MPLAGYIAILTRGAPIDVLNRMPVEEYLKILQECQRLAALAPWRIGQGIYEFHPRLFREVAETDLKGELPVELLFRLPEWCCYVPIVDPEAIRPRNPGLGELVGFFVHLEHDANTGRVELRILTDLDNPKTGEPFLLPHILHLKHGSTIERAVLDALAEARRQAAGRGISDQSQIDVIRDAMGIYTEFLASIVSLTLYLCSANAELGVSGKPARPVRPEPKKTKKGLRYFPPDRPREWEVGYRLGAALQAALERERARERSERAERRSPRPHIRKSHWHAFWTGPRDDPEQRKIIVKWLPPIPVKFGKEEDEKIIPVIHRVH